MKKKILIQCQRKAGWFYSSDMKNIFLGFWCKNLWKILEELHAFAGGADNDAELMRRFFFMSKMHSKFWTKIAVDFDFPSLVFIRLSHKIEEPFEWKFSDMNSWAQDKLTVFKI